MAKNRKAAEAMILKVVEEILPGGGNKEYYIERFSKMSDKDFDQYIDWLRKGNMVAIVENLQGKVRLDKERNMKLLKKYGINIMERVYIPESDGTVMLTPIPYMNLKMPVRRQSQTMSKKLSVAEHNNKRDALTGQVVTDSRSSSMSFAQIQLQRSQGAKISVLELIKFRGGDDEAYRAMEREIAEHGRVRISDLPDTGSVKSTESLSLYFKAGMHVDNNLLKKG